MSNISKVQTVSITPAFVNGVWYCRLYINQEKINDYLTMQHAVADLNLLVSKQKTSDDERDD